MIAFHEDLCAIFQALLLCTCVALITCWIHTQVRVIKLDFLSFRIHVPTTGMLHTVWVFLHPSNSTVTECNRDCALNVVL
jgi:hypothetical protein